MSKLYKSPCYCTNLRRSANAITDYYNDALQPIGLNAAQYYLLINLSRLQTANITQWAAHVGLERSTMVRNTRVLLNHGWIEDVPQGPGRQFCLTADGLKLVEQAVQIWTRVQDEIETFLGKKDAETLLRIAEKLQRLEESENDL